MHVKRIAENQCRRILLSRHNLIGACYEATHNNKTLIRLIPSWCVYCISSNGSEFPFCILRAVTTRRIFAILWLAVYWTEICLTYSDGDWEIVTKRFSSRGHKVHEQFIAMEYIFRVESSDSMVLWNDKTWKLNAAQYFLNRSPRLQICL